MRNLKIDKKYMAQLVNIVGKEKAKFVESWKGMIPHQVADAMREEFVSYFFGKFEFPLSGRIDLDRYCAQDTLKLKVNSWLELDDSLKRAASYVKDDFDALTFWDHMRYIAYELQANPGTRSRKALQRFKQQENPDPTKIYRMDFCQFCWRSVPVSGPNPSQYYCHEHNLYCRSSEYIRLKGLQNKKTKSGENKIKHYSAIILKRLKGAEWGEIQQGEDYTYYIDLFDYHKHKLVEAWDNLRIFAPGLVFLALPLVQQYLLEKNVELTSIPEVVKGLETPSPLNDPSLESFRDRYYKDFEFYYHEYYPTLARAEAWMLLEAECEHGGKRAGAGRKKK